jgi:hypothetical protein
MPRNDYGQGNVIKFAEYRAGFCIILQPNVQIQTLRFSFKIGKPKSLFSPKGISSLNQRLNEETH